MKYFYKILMLFHGGSINYHQKKSAGIFNVFTKTVEKLKLSNNNISSEVLENEKRIVNLQHQNEGLDVIRTGNQKMIDKINDFLN